MTATGIDPAVIHSGARASGSGPLPLDDSRFAKVAEALARLGR